MTDCHQTLRFDGGNSGLVGDDFGFQLWIRIRKVEGNESLFSGLLQILEDRYGKKATMITSQLPVIKWYEFIGEPTLADAIMDRLAGNAHRIELKGDSLRKKNIEKKE